MAEGNAELPPAYEKMMVMESTADGWNAKGGEIPEPSTLILVGLGIAGLLAYRRKEYWLFSSGYADFEKPEFFDSGFFYGCWLMVIDGAMLFSLEPLGGVCD